MKTHWKHAMLAELLFLTTEGRRTVIGMIQPNGTRFQSMIVYPDVKDPEVRCLGFYETPEVAKRAVELECRSAFPELRVEEPAAEAVAA